MNEQFEKKINESKLREVKLDSGPLLQRKNAAWEIKEDLIRREEALEIIRTSDVWYAYTEKTPSDADIAFNFMKSEIKALPSVQPKTGHWIRGKERHFLDTRTNLNVEMKEATGKGYHTYINAQCSKCRMITIHDDSIFYQ